MSSATGPASTARPDRRAARRQATREEILAAAWELVREHGLAGLAMRDLARRVGLQAPSLYSYFASKLDIYDAMFHQGYQSFAAVLVEVGERIDRDEPPGAEMVRRGAHAFFSFCVADAARYQLLFQRTIPDFVPSEESFAVATHVYQQMVDLLASIGITDPAVLDIWTALMTGLTSQQLSNDPGGDRWALLVDDAIDMWLAAHAPHLLHQPPEGS